MTATLTPMERRIVTLIVIDGLSDTEIAARLGLSGSTVKTHIRTARAKLGGSGRSYRWWCRAAYALGTSGGLVPSIESE